MLASLTLDRLFENGEICRQPGRYRFQGYTDGTTLPLPLEREWEIDLLERQLFPPILSSGKDCLWLLK
jgi:hypothetical protein